MQLMANEQSQPRLRGRISRKAKAQRDRLAPEMKPLRIEKKIIHGQEVEVKIYPSLKQWDERK